MLKILFIGDVNGKIGRQTVKKILPKVKKEIGPHLTIANAENVAHGSGVTEGAARELLEAGVDWLTTGDHAFSQEKQIALYVDGTLPILRPANFPPGAPGRGYQIIEVGRHKILLINLIGRVFMRMDYDCPFRKFDEILSSAKDSIDRKKISGIMIDIHAEATSEKIALRHYVDGRASAVFGTHTHVATADPQITAGGAAYITDVGMVGAIDGIIGVDKENIIKTFLTQIKHKHQIPQKGKAVFNAVLTTINHKTGLAKSVQPITKHIIIK